MGTHPIFESDFDCLTEVVGGVTGGFIRLTHNIGSVSAAVNFDKEYQNKRTADSVNNVKGVKEGVARAGRTFFGGLFGGITGIVEKPISGARQEGAAGFFKGVGKGSLLNLSLASSTQHLSPSPVFTASLKRKSRSTGFDIQELSTKDSFSRTASALLTRSTASDRLKKKKLQQKRLSALVTAIMSGSSLS